MPAPVREELCSVPVGGDTGWLKNRKGLWIWDHLEEGWQKARHAVPGAVYLIHADSGGYDCTCGWDASSSKRVEPAALPVKECQPAISGDPTAAQTGRLWKTTPKGQQESWSVCSKLWAAKPSLL